MGRLPEVIAHSAIVSLTLGLTTLLFVGVLKQPDADADPPVTRAAPRAPLPSADPASVHGAILFLVGSTEEEAALRAVLDAARLVDVIAGDVPRLTWVAVVGSDPEAPGLASMFTGIDDIVAGAPGSRSIRVLDLRGRRR